MHLLSSHYFLKQLKSSLIPNKKSSKNKNRWNLVFLLFNLNLAIALNYGINFISRNVSNQMNDQQGKKEGRSSGSWGNGPGNEFVIGLVAVLFALWLLKVVADANRYVLLTYKQFENLLRDKKVRKVIQFNKCVYYLKLCVTVNVNILVRF